MTNVLDLNLAIDAAAAHLWKELNSPVNKTPYATYSDFKAADPIGADEWEAGIERTLRVAQGFQSDIRKALKEELFDRSAEIDPNDEHLWTSMIIGWAIGKGMPIEIAKKLANEPWPT
jgi:hypothetical protein